MSVYLITTAWTGPAPNPPDPSQYGVEYTVLAEPGRTNQSGEPRVTGWLGTTNDWYEYAHGEFESVEAAREYAEEHAGGEVYDAPEADCANDAEQGILACWYDAERAAEYWPAEEWLHDVRGELKDQLRAGDSVDALMGDIEAGAADATGQERPAGVRLLGLRSYLKELAEEVEA